MRRRTFASGRFILTIKENVEDIVEKPHRLERGMSSKQMIIALAKRELLGQVVEHSIVKLSLIQTMASCLKLISVKGLPVGVIIL